MKRTVLFMCFVCVLVGCSRQKSGNDEKVVTHNTTKASWMSDNHESWPQILLTNEMEFKDRAGSFGASSFLLRLADKTVLCTARHLLGPDMGIEPEVPFDSLDQLLVRWIVYPRHNVLSQDTLHVSGAYLEGNYNTDIITLTLRDTTHSIQALEPRFDMLKEKEPVFIIGCEYGEPACHQNVYKASVISERAGRIYILCQDEFVPNGFSGAPVIDQFGNVVGVLRGATSTDDGMIAILQSLSSLGNE